MTTSASDWLWESASCGYASTTPDGVLTVVNTTLERWLGRDAAELVGHRSFADLLTPEARCLFDSDVLPLMKSEGRVRDAVLDLERADGSSLGARISAVLERDDDGEPLAVRIVVVAATDQKSYAAELLVAEERAGESEMRARDLVHALQQTLIPPAPPSVPGLDVAAAYHPALGEVGGDFYDVFEVADGDWCVAIGDVSGKGIDAAIVTASARHAVRSSALREPVPSGLLTVLNTALAAHSTTRFCTVALLRLQRTQEGWVATMSSGGHPFPLLTRHGSATPLGKPGSLLGVFDDVVFHDVSIKLASGDALVLYTDGVIEARNDRGEFFGDERLHRAVTAGGSARAMVDAVVSEVLEFQRDGSGDDIALVIVRRP